MALNWESVGNEMFACSTRVNAIDFLLEIKDTPSNCVALVYTRNIAGFYYDIELFGSYGLTVNVSNIP